MSFQAISSVVTPRRAFVVLATTAVVRMVWMNRPEWVRSKKKSSHEKDANDDLATPSAIWLKLKDMYALAYEMSDELIPDEMPWFKLYACFMSMIHLQTELQAKHSDFKDRQFSQEGEPLKAAELETLNTYLDYAQWAYFSSVLILIEQLRPRGFQLVRQDIATEPGRVGHYIAVNHKQKQVILAIKGTSTFNDVLTDIIGKAIPHTVGDSSIRCHEGMYTAARMIMDDSFHMIENFFLPQGYKLVVCGHSLGAGVSSLLGVFLKEKFPTLSFHVYAYATPACLSYNASIEAQHYLTSVVNNTDCVPRLSLLNLRLMHKVFLKINDRLEDKGLSPNNLRAAKAYFSDLLKIDDEVLISAEELTEFINTELDKAEHTKRSLESIDLFVPGRVVSLWNMSENKEMVGGRAHHGGMKMVRQLIVESTMVADHSIANYRTSITKLIAQTK